jgi:pyridoxine kinase
MAILSIQSHVAYGYVGNRAATFPLQRLGREVWAVNTVEFSNHTGYPSWAGPVLGAQTVRDLVLGIEKLGVLGGCEALLSGYLGDAAVGEAVLDALDRVRKANPDAVYCCDPVMGDYGRGFFVREGIPEILKKSIVPAADIVTPNQFELEALTGQKVGNLKDARRAIDMIHENGPRVVLVTSYRAADSLSDHIDMLVSDTAGIYRVRTPELPFAPSPNGVGDLTAALFLSRWLETGDAAAALELTTDSIFAVLERTLRAGRREIALVEAQNDLAAPVRRFSAVRVA